MTPPDPPTIEEVVDRAVRRLHLFGKAALTIAACFTLAGGWIAHAITADVKGDVTALRYDFRQKAALDSVRFERMIEVVELAVIAVVEPDSSAARAEAIGELRRRRRVTP